MDNFNFDMTDDNKYNKAMVDVPEDSFDTDIKINPDFYIHMAILKMQNALLNPNLREGFVRYRIYIEHIEVLCRAADMLIQNYDVEIDEHMKSAKFLAITDDFKKEVSLANKKLELMMKAVFKKKPLTDPMKI